MEAELRSMRRPSGESRIKPGKHERLPTPHLINNLSPKNRFQGVLLIITFLFGGGPDGPPNN
jgi:hypothetical protein